MRTYGNRRPARRKRLVDRVQRQGGPARVLRMAFTDADEHAMIGELNSARDAEYTELLGRLPELRRELADERARGNATYAEVEETDADLERFRTGLAKIAARDPEGQAACDAVEQPPVRWSSSKPLPSGAERCHSRDRSLVERQAPLPRRGHACRAEGRG